MSRHFLISKNTYIFLTVLKNADFIDISIIFLFGTSYVIMTTAKHRQSYLRLKDCGILGNHDQRKASAILPKIEESWNLR